MRLEIVLVCGIDYVMPILCVIYGGNNHLTTLIKIVLTNIELSDFEIVFRSQYASLYQLAFRYLQDADNAKDIVGEAFLAVWNKRQEIDAAKISGYLFACVKNKCLTYLGGSYSVVNVDETSLQNLSDTTYDDWMLREERLSEMEHVMASLPSKTRYVLEQCYYQHRSYRDVAEELGISTAGVKKHIVKALATLRRHFNIIK